MQLRGFYLGTPGKARRLMAEYEKKVRAILVQNHCVFVRLGKGDHDI